MCAVTVGSPPISFTWLKDGHPISKLLGASISLQDDYQNVLQIEQLSVEHVGNYTCTAKNAFGTDQMSVSVGLKYTPRFVSNDTSIPAILGEKVEIDCRYVGYPAPVLSVTKGLCLDNNNDDDDVDVHYVLPKAAFSRT